MKSITTTYIKLTAILMYSTIPFVGKAQTEINLKDGNTPLHMLQPDYPTRYGKTTVQDIKQVLDRVYGYLNATTPAKLINKESGNKVSNYGSPGKNSVFEKGDFRLISYEWGVTYAGMLQAGQVTGDQKFIDYTSERFQLISDIIPYYKEVLAKDSAEITPVNSVVKPHALDDAGAMCAAMIKGLNAGLKLDLQPLIKNYIDYISYKEYRLKDGTLARNRPLPNTLWLDDLFMSVPSLAQMGKFTGQSRYFDDGVKQVLQFAGRMFNKQQGIFMHGWVQDMKPHPEFHWGRANGWALMSIIELLDVLPANHPGRQQILDLLQAHAKGLASYQSSTGFWHQLLDKDDSYLETSCTAIYTYCFAKAINRGWLDKTAYGPITLLAWNAVASKVNASGQVEGTCVGTGMAFDPAFYYYRPISKYAAHGYGPVLLAGAEMINLLKSHHYEMNDSAVQFTK
ncbi:glycoside hydrolase family 88 protein [Chitinophagaceae bacterium LB-8]|uniref:Glycoside hydrolase family 88 protein n=1 Tax=Paraflavisolibacter caeni TaxID=2982496 RepID=A0A9X3BFQ8_9BACT|nr:glycoside hydrolase family 88 protein [Paraflavisolibacter caeni]MCU7549429.1 glycoside hydrolase family 88 protein [Paraflavisolibacter caeni]